MLLSTCSAPRRWAGRHTSKSFSSALCSVPSLQGPRPPEAGAGTVISNLTPIPLPSSQKALPAARLLLTRDGAPGSWSAQHSASRPCSALPPPQGLCPMPSHPTPPTGGASGPAGFLPALQADHGADQGPPLDLSQRC